MLVSVYLERKLKMFKQAFLGDVCMVKMKDFVCVNVRQHYKAV